MLVGKYIPNLIAKPFEVSREYAQIIYDQTSSPRLDKVLRKWEQDNWASPDNRQKLAYIILVELLAYQFASPVRWIETQDLLFITLPCASPKSPSISLPPGVEGGLPARCDDFSEEIHGMSASPRRSAHRSNHR